MQITARRAVMVLFQVFKVYSQLEGHGSLLTHCTVESASFALSLKSIQWPFYNCCTRFELFIAVMYHKQGSSYFSYAVTVL